MTIPKGELKCFMESSPPVIDALRRLAEPRTADVSDADLLARFMESRDAGAFPALVGRYGQVVWEARRYLRDVTAAEDAIQTTFLALARHAQTIRRPEALGAWLHRLTVRCTTAYRTLRYHMSAPTLDIPASGLDPADTAAPQDFEQAIDAEIDALPEPYRLAFILCEVEQRTVADAAKSLGCAVGTIESRLTRARQWLRARLTRCGITAGSLSAVFAAKSIPSTARAGAIAQGIGSSPVPTAMAKVTDRAARAGIGMVTTGVGIVGTIGVIGLGGLIWAIVQTSTPSAPVPPQPAPSGLVYQKTAILFGQ